MTPEELGHLVNHLRSFAGENEWIEFKCNKDDPEQIGEYISALSNSAALHRQPRGYIVWGIEDQTRQIVGTKFSPRKKKIGGEGKVGNQELESWLLNHLTPGIEVVFHEGLVEGFSVLVFEVQAAFSYPVRFKENAFIRVGTYKKKLKDYPEKERKLWELFQQVSFETGIAKESLSGDQVLQYLDYIPYFQLVEKPAPDNGPAILEKLNSEGIIKKSALGLYAITNLGGILFARDLEQFGRLGRKALRVIIYQGSGRINEARERQFNKGYAAGFADILQYISDQLPASEVIGQALRKVVRVYPEVAIRELLANALIHQDFTLTGCGPMVEIFDSRIEISNPGLPLIDTLRFIDEPPNSRNEGLARFMRRLNLCEERGIGIDKVISSVELFQLPPPDFRTTQRSTVTVLFAPRKFTEMGREDRVRACYQHACLQHVIGFQMSNNSLRKRLGISDSNYPVASRIIKDAIERKLIKLSGEQKSKKTIGYEPFWA
jgi:predicted HTH transcriptional regulator